MILHVQQQVQAQVADAIRRQFGLADVPAFAIEVPPSRALGDLAVTVAFQLARTLRKPPKAIAQELAGILGTLPGITKVVAAPNGYLNLYLDRRPFVLDRLNARIAPARSTDGNTVVERILRAHLQTMSRLNISYDLLTYESDIVRLKFWAQAFDILKSNGAVFLQTEGKLAGCWVMTIDDGSESDDESKEAEREKVIVR